MSGPIKDYSPDSSGNKDADDFINQQGELVPHNAPARLASSNEGKDEKWDVAENLATQDRIAVSTTPPTNDVKDAELYTGDREVVFIGMYSAWVFRTYVC